MGRHFENNGGMFSTQTAPQYYLRRVYVVMVFVFLISIILFSIFKQYFHNWDGSIVIFVTTLVCLVALFYNSRKMSPVLLNFYGTRLHMRDKFNVEFDIYSLTADDFLFKQNAIEKRKNIGHLRIRNSDYKFVGIENFAELVEYVKENF